MNRVQQLRADRNRGRKARAAAAMMRAARMFHGEQKGKMR